MSKKQLAYITVARHGSGLLGSGMIIEFSTIGTRTVVSGIVVQQIHILNNLVEIWHITCIATISISSWRISRHSKPTIWNHNTIICCPIRPSLNIIYLAYRNVKTLYHVTAYVWQRWALTKQKTTTRNTMVKRNALNYKASIFVYDHMTSSINSVKLNFILKSITEKLHLCVEHRLQWLWSIYLQRCRTAKHTKS